MPVEEPKSLEEKKEEKKAKASIGEGSIKDDVKRRSFISWLAVAWVAFAAATGGFLKMILRILNCAF